MPLPNGQDSEFEQFKREVELKNPSDFLQFGANYFNQKLEIQRNFIKNQEELTLSKGIVLFPPMSQHDSISLPTGVNSRSQSRSSVSLSIPNFRSNSKNGANVFNNTNNDPLAPNPSNTSNTAQNSSGMVFKSPFASADEPRKTPVTISEDPISATAHSTTTSPSNAKAPVTSSASSSMFPPTTTNSSLNSNNIFKGGFDIGQESSRKRINSPLDPSDATTKRKTTPTPNDISNTNSNDNTNEPLNNDNIQEQPSHQIPSRFNAERRTSVSGETLQPDHFDDWVPEHYKEKTEDQLKRLEKSIGKNFLFNKLDSDSKRLVINCLEEKHVSTNEIIIKQGDEGDYFYIVEKGNVEFYVNDVRVNTSGPGSSFGELALMYNNPRAATVVATTDCVLWALDRLTFRKILLGSSFKKRVLYDDLLKSIPVLEKLTTYDRSKLADSLDTQFFEPNEVIIREGDRGENFYLIEYGEVQVIKEKEGVIATLTKGDYFGELALLKDVPRQATIKTTKKTKVATLGKSGFQRLLGPVVEVLKLKDPTR